MDKSGTVGFYVLPDGYIRFVVGIAFSLVMRENLGIQQKISAGQRG
jgi:hypothetical protein